MVNIHIHPSSTKINEATSSYNDNKFKGIITQIISKDPYEVGLIPLNIMNRKKYICYSNLQTLKTDNHMMCVVYISKVNKGFLVFILPTNVKYYNRVN